MTFTVKWHRKAPAWPKKSGYRQAEGRHENAAGDNPIIFYSLKDAQEEAAILNGVGRGAYKYEAVAMGK